LPTFEAAMFNSAASSPNTDYTARGENRWRKLLYIKQDYPDNYVDHTFLEKMQKNVNMRTLDYWTVVWESTVITQHLSSILAFVALFIRVYSGYLSVYTLHSLSSVLVVVGYLFWNRVVGITNPAYQRHTCMMQHNTLIHILLSI
jgi:phosphatidylinositol glycan class C protein